ncbi:hypothetical protein ACFC6U_12850 [Kitasatospora purpeofusca]|uniref:hypothetical protein n=1 Tax=Kitasatospora purpeofusca TaxID=67352 RepID=UPI0035E27A26
MTHPSQGDHPSPGTPLPEHCGVVVLDQEAFTQQPGSIQAELAATASKLADEALSRAGLESLRANKLFPRDNGDGLVFGCAQGYLPGLLDRFLPELQNGLTRYNSAAGGRRLRLRLRVAIGSGPLSAGGEPGDGYGAARNEAHRLVDATVLKWAMAEASPNATHLGAIVSDRVFQDVVIAGYCSLHPDRFIKVIATVPGKTFDAPAWIHVPAPSGGLLTVPPPLPCPPSGTAEGIALPEGDDPGRAHGSRVRTESVQHVGQGMALTHGSTGNVNLSFTTTAERPGRRR